MLQGRIRVVGALAVLSGLVSPSTQAKPKPRADASLEEAILEAPAAPDVWLPLAEYYDEHDLQAQAILCYARFLTLEANPEKSKPVAHRVWQLLVPDSKGSASDITMRAPGKKDDPWWGVDLLVATTRNMRHTAKAASMSDEEFLATALEGITLFVEELAQNKNVSHFWRELAIPYFVQARKQGHTESMAYDMTRVLERPVTLSWVEEHSSALDAYRTWSREWKRPVD